MDESHNIVIVGGGLCGLATALALHRKGIKSLVVEKSENVSAWGAAIGMYSNGWRALEELGVASELREKAMRLQDIREDGGLKGGLRITPYGEIELRCVKRNDLVEVLATKLPPETIRCGCRIEAIKEDPVTGFPILHFSGRGSIKTKILIGCDGSNSVVARYLGMEDPKVFPLLVIRGFTNYPQGHEFSPTFFRTRNESHVLGRIPIDRNLVHFFLSNLNPAKDEYLYKDSDHIKELAVNYAMGFPDDIKDMIKHCDDDSLSLTRVRYRAPWHLWTEDFLKGTTTVAGDAMHVMGPFIGQGGAAGLEDAIVLGRCLAQELPSGFDDTVGDKELSKRVGAAFTRYVNERRMRILSLSAQSYCTGRLIMASSKVVRLAFIIVLLLFGGRNLNHAKYDCGHL